MVNLKPSKSYPLIVAGRRHPVERAELVIGRPTRWPRRPTDGPGVSFGLYLKVDEHSGEDGELEPAIQHIPMHELLGRWPRLDELPGLVLTGGDDVVWDAWYGNDAPPLSSNRLEFGAWSGGAIDVRWSASWDRDGGEPGHLLYEGPIVLANIRLSIFEDESIDALVTGIWGADAKAHFEIVRAPRPPQRLKPAPNPPGRPETVSYQLWPRFLGAR